MVTRSWTCYFFYSELFTHSYQIFSESFMRRTAVAIGMGQILHEPSVSAKTALLPRLTKLLWLSKARQPLITACFLKPWSGGRKDQSGNSEEERREVTFLSLLKVQADHVGDIITCSLPSSLLCPSPSIALMLVCQHSHPGILNLFIKPVYTSIVSKTYFLI